MSEENTLLKDKHILLCLEEIVNPELDYLKKNFCGTVLTEVEPISLDCILYLYGNIEKLNNQIKTIKCVEINVIKEFSTNYETYPEYKIINLGKVPINIHNVGIYFRNLFDPEKDYFDLIKSAHEFQTLTESNKEGQAFRKGIYLSNVMEEDGEIKFNLLRCSSNLSGPTDNFREIDKEIIAEVNKIANHYFEKKVELNHVLAQIYLNSDRGKARIKAHSDKTKDMPPDALIAFTTFYEKKDMKKSKDDMFDYRYNKTSVLTELQFKLKDDTIQDPKLVKKFSIKLYPGSVFVISLETNRLYTHEIKPSVLPIDKIPTRLGYVIRCSKTKAIYKDGQTLIEEEGKYVELEDITEEKRKKLRDLYVVENATTEKVDYGKITFTMNGGDHLKPYV